MINRLKGENCPCCGQMMKEYRRKISSPSAEGLIKLYHMDIAEPDYYHHVFTLGTSTRGGDFAKLRYWDLVEEMPNDDDAKKNSGFWAITKRGRYFVEGRTRVSKYCHVYLGELVKFSGHRIDIREALGEAFDYAELMGVTDD